MPVADSFGRQHVVIDQSNNGRATHAEKIGHLLRGQCHGLRCDGHRLARMKCRDHLRQCLVNRFGQLDAVMLVYADERIARRSYLAATSFMRRQESDDRCEFLWMIREKCRGLDRFGAHGTHRPFSKKSKPIFGTFEHYLNLLLGSSASRLLCRASATTRGDQQLSQRCHRDVGPCRNGSRHHVAVLQADAVNGSRRDNVKPPRRSGGRRAM